MVDSTMEVVFNQSLQIFGHKIPLLYRMNYFLWRSLLAYVCLSHVLSGFQAPKLHDKCPYSHPLPVHDSTMYHTHSPINKLAMAQLLAINCLFRSFSPGNGGAMRRGLFVHRRTELAHPTPTIVFLKVSPETAMLFAPFGCTTHLPLSHSFC